MPRIKKATDAGGTVFYPINISKAVWDTDRNQRLSITLNALYNLIDETKLKFLGDAGSQNPSGTYGTNSMITCDGEVYLSTSATTGLPTNIVYCNGEVVTCSSRAVTAGTNTNNAWSKIVSK